MNPTDFQNIVDHAAGANDRWLFIATLLILLGFAGMVIRWLVRRLEQQTQAHAVTLEKFGEVLHDCGRVLEDVKTLLNRMMPK